MNGSTDDAGSGAIAAGQTEPLINAARKAIFRENAP
jgi:hypothetical protein